MLLKRPALMIGNNNIERKSSIKFSGVMLAEHISSIYHVRTVENKIVKILVYFFASFSMKILLKLYISCVLIPI